MLTLLLLFTLINIISAFINATIINQTTSLYISSQSHQLFERKHLICSSEICIIKCDIYRGCYYTTINVSSLTTTLLLSCTERESCSGMNIFNGASNLTQIKCLNHSSCEYAIFNTPNALNVDIECNYDMINGKSPIYAPCKYTKFNANYAFNVNVNCLDYYSCYRAEFDVNHTHTVIFNSGPNAMYNAKVIATNVQTDFTLNCLQSSSCRYATIYCPNNISCDIDCVGSYSCQDIDIYAGNGDNGLFNLNCLSSYSCRYAEVFCGDHAPCNLNCDQLYSCSDSKIYCANNAECNLNCDGVQSCETSNIYINTELNPHLNWNCVGSVSCVHATLNCLDTGNSTEYIYSTGHSQHVCLTDGCCPFGKHNQSLINCSVIFGINMDCNINCTEYGCHLAHIDGSLASSLNVVCDSYECEYTDIDCPHSGVCNIECLSVSSCQYFNVYSEEPILSFSLVCSGDESCKYSNINLNITQNANISCLGPSSCRYSNNNLIINNQFDMLCAASFSCGSGELHLEGAKSIFLKATAQFASYNQRIIVTDGNMMNVVCLGSYSCAYLDVMYSSFSVIDIECNDQYACYASDWKYITVSNMTVRCNVDSNSCRYLEVMATINTSLTITAPNAQALYDSRLWVSCSSGCMNTLNCMENVTFSCGSMVPVIPNDQCRNCICDVPQNQIQYTQFITNEGWDYCAPTAFPTVNPTNPTTEPTNDPTNDPTFSPSVAPSDYPSLPPTTAPSNIPSSAPTTSPSTAPTVSPTYIKGFEYGFCLDLQNHTKVLHQTEQFQCINYCKSNEECRMINHFQYLKTTNDSRCYIFGTMCKLSYNAINSPSSTVWFKEILNKQEDICNNYPLYWKDIVGDTCEQYQQFRWCKNKAILSPHNINDVQLLKDGVYDLNAADVCCDCSKYGGSYIINNNTNFVYKNHEFNDNILCDWKHGKYNHTQWQTWDNLILYEWCLDVETRFDLTADNDFSCNYLIDYDDEYDLDNMNQVNINLCDWNNNSNIYNNTYYFMLLWTLNKERNILSTYINAQWFEINLDLFSLQISTEAIISFEECEKQIYFNNNNSIYGIYPCSVTSVLDTTMNPTYYPSINPSIFPSIIPTNLLTIQPTFYNRYHAKDENVNTLLIILLCVFGIVIIILFIVIIIQKKRMNKKEIDNKMEMEMQKRKRKYMPVANEQKDEEEHNETDDQQTMASWPLKH